ncbi:MAG: xylan 1,4-beta-xylosidase [Clostridia bacterium]|nr:xylan 1,4-beta-xylosidase [Clostridia bacterium]
MKKEKRFERIYSQNTMSGSAAILVDKETGVNYLYCQGGYSGGLTPLLDSEGKVVITPIPKE